VTRVATQRSASGTGCGCAARCRYEELSKCKKECLVIDCDYGALEGYVVCTDFPARIEQKFDNILTFALNLVFPKRKHTPCSLQYLSQAFSTCISLLDVNFSCVDNFGMCNAPTRTCTRVSPSGCMECVPGPVNSASVCQTHCDPGLLPHSIARCLRTC